MIILTQLLSALIVSIVASVIVLRYSDQIATISRPRVLLLSIGLLAVAIGLSFVPALTLSTLLPSPETRTSIQKSLFRATIVGGFSVAAMCYSAATIIALSPSADRTHNLTRYLGPVLGVLGVGSLLPFSCARALSGILHDKWGEVIIYIPPTLLLLGSIYLASRGSAQHRFTRTVLSCTSGIGALLLSFGFMAGYFEGLLSVLG